MGAGYHGGFGAAKGSALKILPSSGSTPAIKSMCANKTTLMP